MRCSDIVELNPTLQTLLDEFITNAVRDLNFEIREVAVKAMGCACLRSIKAAKKHLLIILSVNNLIFLVFSFSSKCTLCCFDRIARN